MHLGTGFWLDDQDVLYGDLREAFAGPYWSKGQGACLSIRTFSQNDKSNRRDANRTL